METDAYKFASLAHAAGLLMAVARLYLAELVEEGGEDSPLAEWVRHQVQEAQGYISTSGV